MLRVQRLPYHHLCWVDSRHFPDHKEQLHGNVTGVISTVDRSGPRILGKPLPN
jgi:hypothetical protein